MKFLMLRKIMCWNKDSQKYVLENFNFKIYIYDLILNIIITFNFISSTFWYINLLVELCENIMDAESF